MSATVDAERFSNYLDKAPVLTVPGRTFPVETMYLEDAIELTGFTNEGQESLEDGLEDSQDDVNIAQTAPNQGSHSGANLSVYSAKTRKTLTRMNEYRLPFDLILQLLKTIANTPSFRDYSKAILIFLPGIAEIRRLTDMIRADEAFQHGWLTYPMHSALSTEDQEGAFVVPTPGIRKIVLATNIAETGITIPDVTCVLDTGKHKEMR